MTHTSGLLVSCALAGALLVGCSGSGQDAASGSSATAGSPGATSATAGPTAAATSSPPASATKTGPAPRVETAKPSVALSTAPAVPVGRETTIVGRVFVDVISVRKAQLKAEGPGEVAGPGARVEIEVKNESGQAFDLGGLAVTASYGKDKTPASSNDGPPGRALTGQLASGASATGIYLFRVPSGDVGSLRIEVSSDKASSILVFRN